MKVLVIGARRRRQGIGEFVARWLHREGAEVCAVVGTSPASVLEARHALREERDSLAGFECRGYSSLDTALDAEKPEAVAICSPYAFRREHIEAVARAGAHCFCEKPFFWSEAAEGEGEASRLAGLFAARGLHLALITQWPQLLPAFYSLFPGEKAGGRGCPIESFEMQMSPSATGRAIVPDSMPHPVSLLQALLGPGEVEEGRAEFADAALRELRIGFRYHHGAGRVAGRVAVVCRFRTTERPPRAASFGINRKTAHRRISPRDYTFSLEADGGRRMAVDDPLQLHVREFIRNAQDRAPTDVRRIVEGVRALDALDRAVRAAADAATGTGPRNELRKVS